MEKNGFIDNDEKIVQMITAILQEKLNMSGNTLGGISSAAHGTGMSPGTGGSSLHGSESDREPGAGGSCWPESESCCTQADGVIAVRLPQVATAPEDRLDTGNPRDKVYTRDLFSLSESPRLGCGIMEMEATTFDWTLNYDEIDYVIEGSLTIIKNGRTVTAGPGELILIPKGSVIQFSVPRKARFLYVTYPADWVGQA